LPTEIVPATLKKSARPAAPRRACKFQYNCKSFDTYNFRYSNQLCLSFIVGGEGRENRGPRGDRGDYRRKEGGANGDFKPEFRGGLGKLYVYKIYAGSRFLIFIFK
jgi:small subunit ribosomal protein S10e